jgi:hypothetical protein
MGHIYGVIVSGNTIEGTSFFRDFFQPFLYVLCDSRESVLAKLRTFKEKGITRNRKGER